MNLLKHQLAEILNAKMDRKSFLKNVGIGFVALMGFSAVMRLLSQQQTPKKDDVGYSSSAYGGNSKVKNVS